MADMHIGRSWSGHPLEDECPCPKEACGLVQADKAVPECPHHWFARAKTMRQGHQAANCPGQKTPHA